MSPANIGTPPGLERTEVCPICMPVIQHTPRRSAHRAPGVRVRKPHAFGGDAIDVGSADLRLSVAPELAVAEIVGHNEHDVGRSRSAAFGRCGRVAACEQRGGPASGGCEEFAATGAVRRGFWRWHGAPILVQTPSGGLLSARRYGSFRESGSGAADAWIGRQSRFDRCILCPHRARLHEYEAAAREEAG